jgi:hypothetical protein
MILHRQDPTTYSPDWAFLVFPFPLSGEGARRFFGFHVVASTHREKMYHDGSDKQPMPPAKCQSFVRNCSFPPDPTTVLCIQYC